MKLALNISLNAEQLWREKRIELDLFKCPAWPDLVTRAGSEWPVYVHFPLSAGLGKGDLIDTETRQPVDWTRIESLLAQTATRHVNVHLSPRSADFPGLAHDVADPALLEQVAAKLIKDVASVVQRFGPDKVIAESIYSLDGTYLPQAFWPEVIKRVIEETGCGFLFDLAHARLAARFLGIPPKEYIGRLPLNRLCEMHVTGIQMFDGALVERCRQAGVAPDFIGRFEGRLLDHLPMTDEDWPFLTWAVEQIRQGAWAKPWMVACEYGGMGSWWELMTEAPILETQIPRMLEMVRSY